ncbi:EAL domain-containing protein [Guyparkeria hydrothermalis]|uniref:bifunctional diguanylate cyclase/phosphodiesterase n=1 Tax=Guyparkeria hydrothermalis TaxID=923 RepID=UPI00201FBAA4|nr:EAL domain-containing protein [Guyparkeria hydrothermalis]MCL7743390.1 EAL domain-containing protein [Guyparkeria hydrothermalis]
MKATTDTPVLLKSYLLMVVAACVTVGTVGLVAPLLISDPGPLGLPLTRESAVAALLAGLGLGGHLQRWRPLHYAAGMALLLLIGFSAATNGVHFPSSLDPAHIPHEHLSTEAALLLIAIALCLMIPGGSPLAQRPWQWVGGLMLFLGGVSALWMLLGNAPWLRFHSTTAWVAVLFTLLFGGAMWLAGRQSDNRLSDLGAMAVAAAMAGSLFSALAWYQFSLEHNQELQATGEAELDRVEIVGGQVLTNRIETLRRLAMRWQLFSQLPTAEFIREQDAKSYLDDMESLQLLAMLDAKQRPVWRASRGPSGDRLLQQLLDNEDARNWLSTVDAEPRLMLLAATPSTGRSTSVVAVPISIPGGDERQLLALLDLRQLISRSPLGAARPVAVQLSLGKNGAIDLQGREMEGDYKALLAERELALPYGPRLLARSYLQDGTRKEITAILPATVTLIGLAVTHLVVLLLATGRSRLAHARRLLTTRRELESQHLIQQMILHSDSLEHTLRSVCELLEEHDPLSHCSIMLCDEDGRTLNLAAAPSLSATYRAAFASIPINEAGCGMAAGRKEPIFTDDIATDPRWHGFREVAQANGLRSCWSYPLLTSAGQVLGTFASYREVPEMPTTNHQRRIARAADLVSLAIERHRDRSALEENEQRYRSLFAYNPDAVFSLDAEGQLQSFNHTTETMFDRPTRDLAGRSLIELIDTADRDRVRRAIDRTIRGRTQFTELAVNHTDGSRHDFDVTYLPMVINGQIEAVYGIAKDITIRKRQERRLRTLERSVEASIHGVVIADARRPDLPIIYTNAAFTRMTGYSAEEVLGHNCRFLQGEQTDPDAVREIHEALAEKRPVRVLLRNYRKDGSQFWNELHIAPVEDESGEVSHFVGLQNDVSAHKSYEAQLAFNATHDTLTGLANRSLFEDRLCHTVELSRRRDTRVAVLFVDLDEFKPINDSLGHAVGDKILIEVSRRLDEQMRAEDTLARFGGDEFVALLADIGGEEDALLVAERLLPDISRPYRIDDHELYLSASIGIAISEPGMESPLSLIQQADMAMYRAKQQGRNTCQIFNEEINTQVRRRVGLRNDLQEALEHKDFHVFYQPLVRGPDREITGFEALLRWHHPEHGWVSPATFIPLAEETGQIIPLSEWILERACRDMKSLIDQGLDDGRMAINLSPLQFHRPNFLATIHRTLELTGLPASRLELELTEGILMSETESAIQTLHRLRDSTISVSIDDFGTGFSSLSYLKHLPIDKIKIDRSFIQGVEDSADDAAIVQGIISMAHHLGIQVVAEGIETEAQREILVDWGCDSLQGYLFARPMPLNELIGCLADNRSIVATPNDH